MKNHNKKWTEADISEQTGKRVFITGANSGIGFEAARVLAMKGAQVIMACRNEAKALAAMATIRQQYPRAALHFIPLDLGDLASVREAAQLFFEHYDRLDLLINNAGVMWLPEGRTVDGFESQLGTNHLGHFALTGLLLPALLKQPAARIVTVSSLAHRAGNLYFDDLFFAQHPYGKHRAYAQSKLANLVFARELERRLNAAGAQCLSLAVHPGVSNTNLAMPRSEKRTSRWVAALAGILTPLVGQNALKGALPTLYAATAESVNGGDYIGPDGFYEAWGYPHQANSTRRSRNPELGRKLWEVSEQLTGVSYPFSQEQAPQSATDA